MKQIEILTSELIDILDKYSHGDSKIGTSLKETFDKTKQTGMIIPVLGTQGAGKSTLINALLKENILPAEADETTCIPVEVKYGETGKAAVYFDGNRHVEINDTPDNLSEYVDNNYNPANEKGVERVEIYRKNDLLKKGLTIVDLPGVGSLTAANQKTTERYIQNLHTAIFVTSVCTPILASESVFIKTVWRLLSKAIFVQNNWDNNTKEITDATDHNCKVLNQTANEIQSAFDSNDLITINAADGINGSLRGDPDLLKKSNINALFSKLESIACNWENDIHDAMRLRLIQSLLSVKGSIEKRLNEIKMSAEEVIAKRKEDYNIYAKNTIEINNKICHAKDNLKNKSDELIQFSERKAKECAGSIQSYIHKLINNGVVDGEYLSKAFEKVQGEETKKYFDLLFYEIQCLQDSIRQDIDEVCDTICEENSLIYNIHSFNKEEATKYEKVLPYIGSIGGSIVGALYAPSIGTAIVGGAEVGSLGGPWGMAAGAAIALAAYGIGVLVKKKIQENRAYETRKEIDPIINRIEDELEQAVKNKTNEITDKIIEILDNIAKSRRDEELRLKNLINEPLEQNDTKDLEADKTYIEQILKECDHE